MTSESVPAAAVESRLAGEDLFAQEPVGVAAENDDVLELGRLGIGAAGPQDVGAGAHPDRVLLADLELLLAVIADAPSRRVGAAAGTTWSLSTKCSAPASSASGSSMTPCAPATGPAAHRADISLR